MRCNEVFLFLFSRILSIQSILCFCLHSLWKAQIPRRMQFLRLPFHDQSLLKQHLWVGDKSMVALFYILAVFKLPSDSRPPSTLHIKANLISLEYVSWFVRKPRRDFRLLTSDFRLPNCTGLHGVPGLPLLNTDWVRFRSLLIWMRRWVEFCVHNPFGFGVLSTYLHVDWVSKQQLQIARNNKLTYTSW